MGSWNSPPRWNENFRSLQYKSPSTHTHRTRSYCGSESNEDPPRIRLTPEVAAMRRSKRKLGESPFSGLGVDSEEESLVGFIEPHIG
jgi:hypothetical protein